MNILRDTDVHVYLFDLAGRMILRTELPVGETLLPLTGIETGSYFLRIENKGYFLTENIQIIKE